MPYPAQITGTSGESASGWMSSIGGPYTNGTTNVRYVFYLTFVGTFPNTVCTLKAFKSTDAGLTWAVVDSANSPVVAAEKGGAPGSYGTFLDPSSNNKVWCVYGNTTGLINSGNPTTWRSTVVIQSFDMDTDTWDVRITGGPTLYAQIGNSSNADIFGCQVFVYANGDVQVLYQSAPENIAATLYDRVSTAVYSGGAWAAGQAAFGAGVSQDYGPMNMVLGDGGRVHCFAIATAPLPVAFGDRAIYHRCLVGQVFAAAEQLVTNNIVPAPAQGGGLFVSSAVTRVNSGSKEIVIGFFRPATLNANSYNSFPSVVRGVSANSPVWAEEAVNSEVAKESTEQFVNLPIMVVGTNMYAVWESGTTEIWYSLNSGTGWGAAVNLYTDLSGLTAQYNNGRAIISGGLGFGYITQLLTGGGTSVLVYFEFAEEVPTVPNGSVRLQIFDDGAGEYIFDAPVGQLSCAGRMVQAANTVGGPFVLPSPLAVCKPGLLTVALTNVSPINTAVDVNAGASVNVCLALVFAVPKRCKNTSPDGNKGMDRGVLG